jgi:hypothetical protein
VEVRVLALVPTYTTFESDGATAMAVIGELTSSFSEPPGGVRSANGSAIRTQPWSGRLLSRRHSFTVPK